MTTKPTGAKTSSVEFQSPTRFSDLSKKTVRQKLNFDTDLESQPQSPTRFSDLTKKTARQKLNFDTDIEQPSTIFDKTISKKTESSPTFKKNKRALDADFPFSSSPPLSPSNKVVNKLGFFITPPSSPENREPQQNDSFARLEGTPPPKYMGSLFSAPQGVSKENTAPWMDLPLFSNSLTTETIKENYLIPWNLSATESKLPPSAPRKKARIGSSVFQKQHEALRMDTFKYKVTYLAKGSYSNCYTLEGNKNPIIPGVNNADLVLKAYHGENTGFVDRELRAFLQHTIENYRAVVKAGLPVAKIYNADTAEQDGHILQQRVSGKVNPLDAQQILQVRHFLDTSVRENLLMDLQAQNFAAEKGQVILIDFMEEEEDLHPFNTKVVENWLTCYRKTDLTKDQATVFLNALTENNYRDFVKELLSTYA